MSRISGGRNCTNTWNLYLLLLNSKNIDLRRIFSLRYLYNSE